MPLSRNLVVKDLLQVATFALCLLCASGSAASTTDRYVQILRTGTVEDRRSLGGTASQWAQHLPEAWPILRDMVKNDSDASVRMHTLVGLLRLLRDSGESIPLARSVLGADYLRSLRRIGATYLCNYGYNEGIPVLLELVALSKHPPTQVRMLATLRAATRVNRPDLNPGDVLSKRWLDVTERDKPLLDQALKGWQKWWEQEGDTFVFPRARPTQRNSRPTARRKRA